MVRLLPLRQPGMLCLARLLWVSITAAAAAGHDLDSGSESPTAGSARPADPVPAGADSEDTDAGALECGSAQAPSDPRGAACPRPDGLGYRAGQCHECDCCPRCWSCAELRHYECARRNNLTTHQLHAEHGATPPPSPRARARALHWRTRL